MTQGEFLKYYVDLEIFDVSAVSVFGGVRFREPIVSLVGRFFFARFGPVGSDFFSSFAGCV